MRTFKYQLIYALFEKVIQLNTVKPTTVSVATVAYKQVFSKFYSFENYQMKIRII